MLDPNNISLRRYHVVGVASGFIAHSLAPKFLQRHQSHDRTYKTEILYAII